MRFRFASRDRLIYLGVATVLWCDWSNRLIWPVMIVTMGFGAVGCDHTRAGTLATEYQCTSA